MGIAPEDHARIFERFYRVDKARSRELGGAGLGLAIARWIVQLHKGSISVQSELGSGSVFQVDLPALLLADLTAAAAKLHPGAEKRHPH
jgi:signal transduction histidine kinase